MDAHPATHPTDQTLNSYGLGKLDDRLAEAVNRHLEECPDCRQRVAQMSADSFLGRIREAQARPASVPATGSSLPGMSKLGGESRSPAPSPPPAGTLPPGLADNPDYEILRELGRGGMGVVYLAENKLMGRKEVLKVVSSHLLNRPGVRERFLREIRLAAQLDHPNVVTAFAARQIGDSLIFSMKYVEGYDLAKLVEKAGPLPVAQACNFVYQAALGLQHAHEHGMVHRDIKPSNLMLTKDGNKPVIKVLDFGLAKAASERGTDGGLTQDGQMLGTPHYVAPEQTINAQKADIRADIYSLGCTLYCLLAGHPPFDAPSLYELLQAHHSMDAKPLNFLRPEVPAELAAVVAKMLAKEPERRFQTPKEVAQALKLFFRSGNVAPVGSKPDISQVGPSEARPAAPGAVPMPTRPPTDMAPAPAPAARKPAEPAPPGSILQGLIDLRATDPLFDTMLETPHPAATPELIQRGRLARTTAVAKLRGHGPLRWWATAGLLLLGLVVVWAAVVFRIKTKDGVIVLEELPKDAEVFVDRGRTSVTWPGGGKPAVITVPAGGHGVEVQKDGFKIFSEDVSIEAGDQKRIHVRLEPLVPEAPKADSTARIQKPSETGGQALKTMTNSIGMKLVLIPAGEFLMGSPAEDTRAPANEKPQHRVRITRPFYLGVTEVTRGQFRRFVDATGYRTEGQRDGKGGFGWNKETKRSECNPKFTWLNPGGFEQTDEHPVVQVSWNDAVAFAEWLSSKEGKTYRLPTEAEWEYACLAGSPPLRPLSDDANSVGKYANHVDGPNGTHPVGQNRPNAWGLHGMLGNVTEWCADPWEYYASSPAADPPGPAQGSAHVSRGSDWWNNGPLNCRPAYRMGLRSWDRFATVGFRVARLQDAEKVPGAPPEAAMSIGGTPPVPPAGNDVERHAAAPVVKRETAPAAPLELAAKTPLPPTRLVYADEFGGPRSESARDPDISRGLSHASPGQSDGVHFVYSPQGWHAWPIHGIRTDGTCEVVSRVLSDNPSKTAAWLVIVQNPTAARGFLIKINVRGEFFLEPSPWYGKEAAAFRQIDPRIGPIVHPAVRPGNEFNKLLLILRKREVVIFVNGVQVCEPVRFEYDITPARVCFGAAGPGPKRAEFDRLEIREMTQPDDKPPKAEATPSVTPAVVKPADRPKPGPTRRDNPTKPITNSIGMKLVLIPAGEFLMGSPDDDEQALG